MERINVKLPLLSYHFKLLGSLLFIASLIFAYLYFLGGRPEFFKVRVFAIASFYLEKRYFVLVQSNLLDEIAIISLLSGLAFISFSKEKYEKPKYDFCRIRALFISVWVTIVFWIFLILTIYGMAVFIVSSVVFIFFLLVYSVLFQILRFKDR